MEWVRFIIGAAFLLVGLAVFIIEMIGVFRFKYVMNRMHAAAMGDTLGIGCTLLGLIIINGANLTSLKLACIIVFLWFSSPTSSHLIARLELTTDEEPQKHYRKMPLKKLEAELDSQTVQETHGAQEAQTDIRQLVEPQQPQTKSEGQPGTNGGNQEMKLKNHQAVSKKTGGKE